MSARVLAVDVGTSSLRAALVDDNGVVLDVHRTARRDGLGGGGLDIARLHDDVLAALAGVAASGRPDALAIAAHIGSVAVDDDLEPVVPAGGWSDHRGLDRLEGLEPDVLDELGRRAGRPRPTGGALALALSLDPDERGRTAAFLSPKDVLVARLTGVSTTDLVDAAYTMALDVRTGDWNRDLLGRLGLGDAFPPLLAPTDVVAGLGRAAARATGLPEGLPVVAGGPDGSVGLGLLLGSDRRVVADVAGTTDVVGRVLGETERPPPDAVINPALVPGRLVAGGATGLTGGAVSHWRGLVGPVDDDALGEVAPGSDGLRVVPAMTGERFPVWRHGTTGSVLGQRLDHGAAHLVHAVHEAAACTVREGIDVLDPSGSLPVVLGGGSARSRFVAQLRADVLDRSVLVAPRPDVTLLGAAALALVAVGALDDLAHARTTLVGPLREVRPSAPGRYEEHYRGWREHRDLLQQAPSQAVGA